MHTSKNKQSECNKYIIFGIFASHAVPTGYLSRKIGKIGTIGYLYAESLKYHKKYYNSLFFLICDICAVI